MKTILLLLTTLFLVGCGERPADGTVKTMNLPVSEFDFPKRASVKVLYKGYLYRVSLGKRCHGMRDNVYNGMTADVSYWVEGDRFHFSTEQRKQFCN